MGTAKPSAKKKPPFASRGAIVRVTRVALGLTRKQLAQRTGLTYRTLAKVERGDSVSDDTLATVARALDIDFELLKYDPNAARSAVDGSARQNVRLNVDRPFDEMARARVYARFEKALTEMADAASAVFRVLLERGSTIVVLDMAVNDVHRLCLAFIEGRLDDLDVLTVHVLPLTDKQKQARARFEQIAAVRRVFDARTQAATPQPNKSEEKPRSPRKSNRASKRVHSNADAEQQE